MKKTEPCSRFSWTYLCLQFSIALVLKFCKGLAVRTKSVLVQINLSDWLISVKKAQNVFWPSGKNWLKISLSICLVVIIWLWEVKGGVYVVLNDLLFTYGQRLDYRLLGETRLQSLEKQCFNIHEICRHVFLYSV